MPNPNGGLDSAGGECNVSENIISGICVIYVCAIRTLGGNGKRGIRAQGVVEPLGHRFTI